MAIFENFPYTNMHELNLDYILETQRKQNDAFDEVIEEATELKNETSELHDQTQVLKDEAQEYHDQTELLKNEVVGLHADTEILHDESEEYKNLLQGSLNQITVNTENIAINSGRIDEFTQLEEGSTTGDAELADIRVGGNGITYANAGDAVRGQYLENKGKIDFILSAEDMTIPAWKAGGLNADGTENDSPVWAHTTKIKGKRLVGTFAGYHINLNYYKENGDFVGVSGFNNSCDTMLEYGYSYSIAIRNANSTVIDIDDVITDTDFSFSNGLVYACGDSITYGANNDGISYIDYVCDRMGMTLQKYAHTGATWVYTSGRSNILTDVASMISANKEPDFIILSGGYNDAQSAVLNPIGTVEVMGEGKDPHDVYGTTTSNPFSADTVTGAIEYSILALRNKYPKAQFLYVITYKVTSEYHWDQEYVAAIKQVLNKWAIPYVDFTQEGNMVRSAGLPDMTNIFTDNIHPNRRGYEIMSNYVEAKMKECFNSVINYNI